ncbi:hypothetical protein F3Y22_tig00110882pilonHSYRG00071 [Hibiscus syriacus]|uniref:Nicalin n=1 Tax=Hibiscus syriacus TaxID=106335 RepID=A0A6A2ZIN7_HIBSY|nr:hypothetical protein F3Y22_tig00110882pilonHSYRG00071 [Hibiscus syriacus]
MATSKNSGGLRQLLESTYSVIALLFILVACVELCDAAAAVDVYRLIQYDMSGTPFGSRFAALNHHASSLRFPPGADLSRTVLIIPLRELNVTFVREYITQKKPLGGLLFLLPEVLSFKQGGNKQVHEKGKMKKLLMELEQLLVHSNIPYPVYFAFENDDIDTVLADIKKNDAMGQPATATTGGYKLVIPIAEPKKVASPTITNIQGWLSGLKADEDANQLPTIAIVASYDTFGAAPALSWEVTAMEVALWLFLKWQGFSIFSTQTLRQEEAEELDLKVVLKHKKINISDPRVAWEHEQFSRLRVTAATLSGCPVAPELFEGTGGLFDGRQYVNETAIVRGVKLVAESLARHIYGHQGKSAQIFADESSLSVNPAYIRSWLNLLSQTPRVAPYLSKNDPFVMALKKELAGHADEVNVQHENLEGIFTFYDSTSARLNIYQVASVTFDLLLLLVLGSYLIMLFCFLVITTRGVDDLIGLFRRPPSRRVKTA